MILICASCAASRMSIYVGVNPDDLHRLRPVLNLFFQQAIGLQTRELPEHNPKLKHQVHDAAR